MGFECADGWDTAIGGAVSSADDAGWIGWRQRKRDKSSGCGHFLRAKKSPRCQLPQKSPKISAIVFSAFSRIRSSRQHGQPDESHFFPEVAFVV